MTSLSSLLWICQQMFIGTLALYADLLAGETGQSSPDPAKLVAPMLARFMATDRAFAKARRKSQPAQGKG
jgi:hypothetical protein